MKNNKFKQVCLKNYMRYYMDGMIKFEHFHSYNILVDEKSFIAIHIKLSLVQNHCVLGSTK